MSGTPRSAWKRGRARAKTEGHCELDDPVTYLDGLDQRLVDSWWVWDRLLGAGRRAEQGTDGGERSVTGLG